jgi:hypothetical protein
MRASIGRLPARSEVECLFLGGNGCSATAAAPTAITLRVRFHSRASFRI